VKRMKKPVKFEGKTPIEDVRCRLEKGTLILESKRLLTVLSSAVLNGGIRKAKAIINHHVPKNFHYKKPGEFLRKVAGRLNLPEPVVGLMTAADVRKAATITHRSRELTVYALVTAGLSNPATAGDRPVNPAASGTINIILLVDGNLSEGCMVGVVKTATEAKAVALRELDVRSQYSGQLASGTTSDALAVAHTGRGALIEYAGTATKLGELVGRSVKLAVKEAVLRQNGLVPHRPLIQRLKERGITLNRLVQTAMRLCVHHPSMGSKERIRKILEEGFDKALADVNVAALVMAGLRLEEEGSLSLLPGMPGEIFREDPVNLLADEILGMAISNYIAGSKGVFEFVRFDKAKPGVLGKLGPFSDDAIGGLVAGVSSNMYTALLGRK